ncbi:adenine deaminase [Evansella sp. AB-P1]|uniref:adenine deaminase n=1 Tax=Evansella sp. AB-P1 TaxID=3037653 RepID=UPI00241E0260|nr:adenine deaminase [Evansella sp. AB-P1]MDG5789572.1 adenine deaminase [Evansella sp. AB-P1]
MEREKEDLLRTITAASNSDLVDLVIKNGKIVDVFNHEIIHEDVAVQDGIIVGLGTFKEKKEIDAKGKYVTPAFIDSHVHIESSMVTPSEFAKVVLPHGVTTVVADPHEIANVSGKDGIQFMLDSSEGLPLNVYVMLPSCVPATPFENAGALLGKNELESFYSHPRVLGLGEVMDYPSVLNKEDSMMEKIYDARKKDVPIDGHGAGLNAAALNIYTVAGIKTDHEAVTVEEAKERLKRGMYLIIRQGSVAKDLPNLIKAVTDKNSRRCIFCTDDKHIEDLIQEGSINFNVKLAIENGLEPISAIQMASLNAAECYGLKNTGAIAPGYRADFLLLNDLETVDIDKVYSAGTLVAENGSIVKRWDEGKTNEWKGLIKSVNMKPIIKKDLEIYLNKVEMANVIEIIPNSLITRHIVENVPTKNGLFQPSTSKDLLKLAVIERHNHTGNVGLGIVKGLNLKSGAIATTIAHDSHNVITAGTTDEDMLLAIERINEIGGGLVVVKNRKVISSLSLKISGLLSENGFEVVNDQLKEISDALKDIEASEKFNPFLTLSFLALPVIPEIKLTDKGLFDVKKFKHIDIN